MILHASFEVEQPRAAAEAVAELMGGFATPFPEFGDAWLALSGDAHGTLVEFLPGGTELHLAPGRAVAHVKGRHRRESGCHILLESPLDVAAVLETAQRRGCRAHQADHGPLRLIEVWIEGCLLIEVVTPEQAAAYRDLASPMKMRGMLGPN